MKNKIIFSSFFFVLLSISLYIFSAYAQNDSIELPNSLKVSVKSQKSVYILGEVVFLDIELRNEGASDIRLHGFDAQSGYLTLLISDSQGDFKEYTNAAWGNNKSKPKTLKAGQTVMSQATVLANAITEVSHLNIDAAKRASEGKIKTNYAFPKAGVYNIKAVLSVPSESSIKIQSTSIQITVNEPVDEDLEVWNKIKNRSDIAYFIQENQSIADNNEEKEKFLQEVKQIREDYLNSQLAGQIKQSVEKFHANETKRKKFMEKLRQSQKPK